MNKFLFLVIMASTAFAALFSTTAAANAQAPPLEKTTTTSTEETATDPISSSSLGKITIQISQTEQIVIDLPLKSENKYKVIPIK
jgi:hypothetical protein